MRTLKVHPHNLTVSDLALISGAFQYRVLMDGTFLISVPAPIGYINWVHDDAKAIDIYLFDNNIKEVER